MELEFVCDSRWNLSKVPSGVKRMAAASGSLETSWRTGAFDNTKNHSETELRYATVVGFLSPQQRQDHPELEPRSKLKYTQITPWRLDSEFIPPSAQLQKADPRLLWRPGFLSSAGLPPIFSRGFRVLGGKLGLRPSP
jgi:hypothetical protein